MSNYKKIFDQMISDNRDLFIQFKLINDQLEINPKDPSLKAEFDKMGEGILEIIRKYEDILCGRTERSKHSQFVNNLSEKFWQEIRKNYSMIDDIGVS